VGNIVVTKFPKLLLNFPGRLRAAGFEKNESEEHHDWESSKRSHCWLICPSEASASSSEYLSPAIDFLRRSDYEA
jgi:hypothetical protein